LSIFRRSVFLLLNLQGFGGMIGTKEVTRDIHCDMILTKELINP